MFQKTIKCVKLVKLRHKQQPKHDLLELLPSSLIELESWTKGWRQIYKIMQNRFFYGILYS